MGGDPCAACSWPSAGAAAPRVTPPANAAPLFRSSRRLKRLEPMGLSFAGEPKKNEVACLKSKYTPVSGPIEQVPSACGAPFSLRSICDRRAGLKARAPENHRTKRRRALRDVVSGIFASWSQLDAWLRQMDGPQRQKASRLRAA